MFIVINNKYKLLLGFLMGKNFKNASYLLSFLINISLSYASSSSSIEENIEQNVSSSSIKQGVKRKRTHESALSLNNEEGHAQKKVKTEHKPTELTQVSETELQSLETRNAIVMFEKFLPNDLAVALSLFVRYKDTRALRCVSVGFNRALMSEAFYDAHRGFFYPSTPENMGFGKLHSLEANEAFFNFLTRPSFKEFRLPIQLRYSNMDLEQLYMDEAGAKIVHSNGLIFASPQALPCWDGLSNSYIVAMSADGSRVFRSLQRRADETTDLVLCENNKIHGHHMRSGPDRRYVFAFLNKDGSTVVSHFYEDGREIPHQLIKGTWHQLACLERDVCSPATGISDDGLTISGNIIKDYHSLLAVKWIDKGIQVLPMPEGWVGHSQTSGMSSDGHTIIGDLLTLDASKSRACMWVNDICHTLPLPQKYVSSHARNISKDGSTILGWGVCPTSEKGDILWKNGEVQTLPHLEEGYASVNMHSMSNDGSSISGVMITLSHIGSLQPKFFLWRDGKIIPFLDHLMYLDDYPKLDQCQFQKTVVSANGLIVAGLLRSQGLEQQGVFSVFRSVVPREGPGM